MAAPKLSVGKKMGEAVKAGCRLLASPILPILPDTLANQFPFLGRICVQGPDNLRVRFHTYGPFGKDRIALKLAKRGFWAYEGETTRIFLPLVEKARCVVDIGANTGLFALLAGKANPACRVLAFEPIPFIFEMLEKNIRLNRLTNVEAVPAAISDATGEATFFVSHTAVGVPTDSSACAGFRTNVHEVRVPTTTLDEMTRKSELPALDVVKIDAEATETQVIRGGIDTLRTHRPYVICEVLENVDQSFVQETFASLDYEFYHIGPERLQLRRSLHGSLADDKRNYLFAPKEKTSSVHALGIAAGIQVVGAE